MTTFQPNQRITTLVETKGADHNDVEHILPVGQRGFIESIETLPAQGITHTVVIWTGTDGEHIVNVFDEGDGPITDFIAPAPASPQELWNKLAIVGRNAFLQANRFQLGYAAHTWTQLPQDVQARFEVV